MKIKVIDAEKFLESLRNMQSREQLPAEYQAVTLDRLAVMLKDSTREIQTQNYDNCTFYDCAFIEGEKEVQIEVAKTPGPNNPEVAGSTKKGRAGFWFNPYAKFEAAPQAPDEGELSLDEVREIINPINTAG